jgi:hypothetical protein
VAVVQQYTIQYNTQKTKKQNNTYTLKTIHNTIITNTITQNYKHNAQKETGVKTYFIHTYIHTIWEREM